MKQTDKNIYRIKLECERCRKSIFVCFSIAMKEIPQYGPEENYIPTDLPEYLKHIMNTTRKDDGMSYGSSMMSHTRQETERKYGILCRKCEKIEKIKE